MIPLIASRLARRLFHTSPHALKLVPLRVPSMGDSIVDGVINSIIAPGTRVKVDDVLASIETDKAR